MRNLAPFIAGGMAAACTLALLAQPPANPGNTKSAPTKSAGEVLFGSECATCHQSKENGRALTTQALRGLSPEAVVTALTTGKMSQQAERLSPADRIAVAEFVTGRAIATTQAKSGGHCDAKIEGSWLGSVISKPSWNGWGGTEGSARFAKDGGLTAEQVPQLRLAWAFGFPSALSARTQPTVIGDWLYTAADTGEVFALDSKTGCTRWTYKAKAGVRGALVVAPIGNGEFGVFFGDAQANAYGLDAHNGREIWTLKVEAHPNATITGAPSAYNGRVYFPTSAAGEEVRGQDPSYACCSFRGSVTAIHVTTGERLWKSYTIAEEPKPRGKSSKGVELLGPSGAGTWGSPTIDPARGVLYIGTGNGYSGPEVKTMNAIIAMDLTTGAQKWVQQTVPGDIWLLQCESQSKAKGKQVNANCPDEEGPDFDFAASPLITRSESGRDLLIVPQKSGVLWALDPDKQGEVVWQYRYGQGSGMGGQWGAASDGVNAYIGTGDAQAPVQGGMHAVNLDTGKRAWSMPPQAKLCDAKDQRCTALQSGAITAIPGIAFSGGSDGGLRAYSSKDGKIVWTFDTNRPFQTVNGVPASGGSMDASGAVVAGGMLYMNSGYNGFVTRGGNVLLAFRVQ